MIVFRITICIINILFIGSKSLNVFFNIIYARSQVELIFRQCIYQLQTTYRPTSDRLSTSQHNLTKAGISQNIIDWGKLLKETNAQNVLWMGYPLIRVEVWVFARMLKHQQQLKITLTALCTI